MVNIYTNYDGLDVDATYQVSCKSDQWFLRIILRVYNIYGYGGHHGHVLNIMPLNLILLV